VKARPGKREGRGSVEGRKRQEKEPIREGTYEGLENNW
jgi:hypothetical protein